MREIKFRAFVKNLKWLLPVITIDFDEENCFVEVDYTGEGDYADYNFNEIELMQYVGLKDKNGKEIYEGDIIKLGTEERFYVAWHDYKQEFTFRGYGGGYYPNTYRGATRDDEYGWEVIGNIYENKELLTA